MIKDTIRSILFPSKMGRFRHMSVLFSVMIFILASYVITGSNMIMLNLKGVDNPDLHYRNIDVLLEIDESTDVLAFPSNCTLTERKLGCGDGPFYLSLPYPFSTISESGDPVSHYVFFVYDLIATDSNDVVGKYPEFQDSKTEPFSFHVRLVKGTTFEPMTGIKTPTSEGIVFIDFEDGDLTDQLEIEGTVDTDTVGAYMIYYSVTDSDGNKARVRRVVTVVEDNEDEVHLYLFTFITSSFLYESIDPQNLNRIVSESVPYSETNFDISELSDNAVSNLKYLAERVTEYRILTNRAFLGLTSLFLVLVLPLPIILISMLLFKRTGSLKRFKEYYNLAAIAIISPSVLAFGIGFFVRFELFSTFYYLAYQMFYIYCVFKVNKAEAFAEPEPVNIYSRSTLPIRSKVSIPQKEEDDESKK